MRKRTAGKIILSLFVLAVLGAGARFYKERPWFFGLVFQQLFQKDPASGAKQPVDLIFVFADHYEPHHIAAIERWERMYPRIARRHRDSDGRMPQHTFFWHWHDPEGKVAFRNLERLAKLAYEGYGELEMHLHHDNDPNPRSVIGAIKKRIRWSQMAGAFITAEEKPKTTYAFIHGMWALDNSRNGRYCGINNEIEMLRTLGCYADFTNPSWGVMTPKKTNALYYVKDDPHRPKSYDDGRTVHVGGKAWGDLLIFEGPSVLSFERGRLRYDQGDVTMKDIPTPERIDRWVRAGIHVEGRPEWIFVKVFTHGTVARDHEAVLGKWAETMYGTLEKRYNDGKRYRLHYATAREAFNILKAAEGGHSGNPNGYRDFLIPPYANRKIKSTVPYHLISYSPERIELVSLSGDEGQFEFKEGPVQKIQGTLSRLVVDASEGQTPHLRLRGKGTVWVTLRETPAVPLRVDIDGGGFQEVRLR